MTLDSEIQTNQILTNYGEVCIPRFSNILLYVVLNAWNAWIEMLETFIKAQQPAWIRLKIDVLWNSLSTRKIFTTGKSGYTRLKSLSVSNSARIHNHKALAQLPEVIRKSVKYTKYTLPIYRVSHQYGNTFGPNFAIFKTTYFKK